MANSENLKPVKKGDLTKEEAKRRGSNGGKKSGERRRERKKLKELLELALQNTDENGEQNDIAITAAIIRKAAKGDVSAYLAIRDTLGEKPADKHELNGEFKQKALLEDIKNLKKMLDE